MKLVQPCGEVSCTPLSLQLAILFLGDHGLIISQYRDPNSVAGGWGWIVIVFIVRFISLHSGMVVW